MRDCTSRERRCHQTGSSPGELVVMLALGALLIAVVAAVFSYSPLHGYTLLGVAAGVVALVVTFGLLRDRRMEGRRVERCREELEHAAAALPAALEATFYGAGQGGPAAFGVAGAARKLIHARHGEPRVHVTVLDFDQLAAAFARTDGKRLRLEVRMRRSDGHGAADALFLLVDGRDEAARWVRVLQPYLGERAKLVERA